MPRWPLHFKAVLGKSVVGSSASQAPCQTSLTSLASCQTSQVFVKRTVARGGGSFTIDLFRLPLGFTVVEQLYSEVPNMRYSGFL